MGIYMGVGIFVFQLLCPAYLVQGNFFHVENELQLLLGRQTEGRNDRKVY